MSVESKKSTGKGDQRVNISSQEKGKRSKTENRKGKV